MGLRALAHSEQALSPAKGGMKRHPHRAGIAFETLLRQAQQRFAVRGLREEDALASVATAPASRNSRSALYGTAMNAPMPIPGLIDPVPVPRPAALSSARIWIEDSPTRSTRPSARGVITRGTGTGSTWPGIGMSGVAALGMGAIFGLLIVYPWIEKKLTGDNAHHNLLQRPRDAPVRTAVGAAAIGFYMVLTLGPAATALGWGATLIMGLATVIFFATL